MSTAPATVTPKAFDIWGNHDGKIIAREAEKPFVTDADAPYTFHKHEMRVEAVTRRETLAKYRADCKAV